MNSGGDTCSVHCRCPTAFACRASEVDQLRDLRDEAGGIRGLKSPVAYMTLDGTLSSSCSLCCKRTDRLPATHTVAFSCSLPRPHPQPRLPPRLAPSQHLVWSYVSLSLSSLPTHRRAASLATLHPSPCLVPSASSYVSVCQCLTFSLFAHIHQEELICLVYGC